MLVQAHSSVFHVFHKLGPPNCRYSYQKQANLIPTLTKPRVCVVKPPLQIMYSKISEVRINQYHILKLLQQFNKIMQKQIILRIQKSVFGDYEVTQAFPFRIVQAPFRKFRKYDRDGHWNQKERLKYTVFLQFFRELFEDQEKKKNARIYEMMSDMIITRNPNQCRSHHQKMEKYRSNIQDIITSVTQKYEPRVYKEIYERYLALIKILLENTDKYIRIPTPMQNRKVKLKRELLFLNQCRLQQQQQNQAASKISQESGLSSLEQVDCKKEDNKKTAVQYDEDDELVNQGQEEIPIMQFQALKEECVEDEGFYREIEQKQKKSPQVNTKKREIQPSKPQARELPHISYLSNPTFNGVSQMMYQQQLKTWEFQKQWHIKNADHLMRQWKNEIESIKLCDEKIQFYKDTVSL